MFKNYLTIALRNIKKYKVYSFVNIVGLAVGLSCCILISEFIFNELSYDKFHKNADNIYRVATDGKIGNNPIELSILAAPAGPALVSDFPEVLDAVRIKYPDNNLFSYENKHFFEFAPLYVDKSFFNVFSFKLIKGDPKTALETPFSLILTQELAEKYFGNENPIGKVITINNDQDYTVTGIVEKPPQNSHFTFDILASFETLYKTVPEEVENWGFLYYQTYLLLQEGTNYQDLEMKLPDFIENHVGDMLKKINAEYTWNLQPLSKIHLYSHFAHELGVNSDIRYIYIFAAIGLLILLIACFNFMNLSTACSATRSKEVGIRKVLGAGRGNLIHQFLSESFLFAVLSLILAMIIVAIVLPSFNNLVGMNLKIVDFIALNRLGIMLCITLVVGLFAGSYPAFFLSRFGIVKVLRKEMFKNFRGAHFRSLLVVFQFAISIILIVGTTVINDQLYFMRNTKLGFNKEQMLVIPLRDTTTQNNIKTTKYELSNIKGVIHCCSSLMVPGEKEYWQLTCLPEDHDQTFQVERFSIDDDFLETYGIEVLQGRGFSNKMETDEDAVLINETAAKGLGWKNPIGKKIRYRLYPEEPKTRTVIGVIKDIHHKSLHEKIGPSLIDYSPDSASRLTLKLNTADILNTMKMVKQQWSELAPNHPFEYFFLDEYFNNIYNAEEKLGFIFEIFSSLAVSIGCMGLLGLASFISERRKKEIGIRKVLGANVTGILFLLNKEFTKSVLIANIVAWPIAYYFLNNWLQDFAYRVEINIWVFFIAGIFALLIAIITVSFQSIKAATANPINSISNE
ncbi:MAG: ABC transporter permease [Ignavibacteria bacterium]